MCDILAITCPIFIAILIGFVATRQGMFDKAAMRVFGTFVARLALPALLFKALAQRQIGDIINGGYLLAYAGASLAVVGIGYIVCRRAGGLGKSTSAVYVMGMSSSNSALIGYPILLLTFAPVAGVALALNVIVENVIVIPLLLALAERGRNGGGPWYRLVGQALARLAANPIVIAVAAGLAMSLLRVTLPAPLERTVNLFAMSSSALSLIVIGGALVGVPIGGLARRARRCRQADRPSAGRAGGDPRVATAGIAGARPNAAHGGGADGGDADDGNLSDPGPVLQAGRLRGDRAAAQYDGVVLDAQWPAVGLAPCAVVAMAAASINNPLLGGGSMTRWTTLAPCALVAPLAVRVSRSASAARRLALGRIGTAGNAQFAGMPL